VIHGSRFGQYQQVPVLSEYTAGAHLSDRGLYYVTQIGTRCCITQPPEDGARYFLFPRSKIFADDVLNPGAYFSWR